MIMKFFGNAATMPTQTNADRIRSMNDEELVERNVLKVKIPITGQYDYGESYTDYFDAWETSDGAIYWTKNEAVDHERDWLKQPADDWYCADGERKDK